MNRLIYLIFSMAVITLYSTNTYGQDSGFYVGASFQGAAWTMPDLDFDTESGGGFGLKAGYSINTNFGLFMSLEGANINPEVGENYGLGHFDIGAEGRLGSANNKFRPYARISYLGMAAVQDDPSGDVEISGAGFGLGAGFYYFFNRNIALDIALVKSWINVNEVKIGSNSVEVDENAETGRFQLGISYHF